MKPPDPREHARLLRDQADTEAQIHAMERYLAELRAMVPEPKVRTPAPDRDYHDRQCPKCGMWISFGQKCPRCYPNGRTVAQVLEMRRYAVMGGCCNRFADQMACDCLSEALEGGQ